ncbi:hypothetical protein [Mesorhizobium sp. ZC-5]|uniref:hypothetical protein n=1 Tax=Mesorhizobium sp. ZC-5 TaxID=2986066 RepID=UPI0021E7F6D2|nr:hypothetical protein [Mesorhizobium sp. ZC-5]MCV3243469.1 hypothetical protein [Mesorhizobium sp. ZC-5]
MTMFDVDPKQIESLEAKDLVLLLRRLLYAEAQAAGVPLSGVSVPLQITVSDGGEDGRIVWTGGKNSTDFLPGRSTFFQCKASKIGRAGWKKECWDKSTHRKGRAKKLTPAMTSIIAQGGCYVGFTTEALTGEKRDDYITGMEEAVIEAGGNPTRLRKIELYDANQIALWAAHHPAVAIWLSEKSHGQSLAGFQTVEAWGTQPDFSTEYVEDGDSRYIIGTAKERDRGGDNKAIAKVAWERILSHVAEPGRLVRVVGTSGLGKSRFVYESLRASSSQLAEMVQYRGVVAEYKAVPTTLLSVATKLAEDSNRTLLVVDECPRDVAIELGKQAARAGSLLSVIAIDTDDQPLEDSETNLHIALSPSSADLIGSIIRKTNPTLDKSTVERLRELCGGFPRFGILAAKSVDAGTSLFETADDVINRILVGAKIENAEEVRALQCLSLFESLSIAATSPVELDVVATVLGRMPGDAMYEHLTKAQQFDIVGRKGDRLSAQPLPIAVKLAMRRVAMMRPSLLVRFIAAASDELALALLRRCRHLDKSPVILEVGNLLLSDDDLLGKDDAILTPRGADLLDALVHVLPDRVAQHLDHFVLPLDDAVLAGAKGARRSLVEAAGKLVFRRRSFGIAARLLMRLGVNENEDWSNNATALFKQLFQLYLSGTEVPPPDRYAILDEGLASDDLATVNLCVEALASVFSSDVIRLGDYGEIGSSPPLKDWTPETYDEIHDFYRDGLRRLASIRQKHPELAERCEDILAKSARLMLSTGIYKEYADVVSTIASEKGGWPDAIESVGDWLYFDRTDTGSERAAFVRELYDRLFPYEPIDRAILFTKFWQSDIRDPDLRYADEDRDYDYSQRAAREVAREISASPELTLAAVRRMVVMDLRTIYPFADELGEKAGNREEAFHTALEAVAESNGSIQMLRGLLHGIDLVDSAMADKCLAEASRRLTGTKQSIINLHSALSKQDRARLDLAIADLNSGRIAPVDYAYLSYGRGLDNLPPEDVAVLLRALAERGSDGVWTALEVAMMYRYGEPAPVAHAHEIAALLVLPDLAEHARERRRDSHTFNSLVDRVRSSIGISERFAEGLAQQLVRLTQSTDYNLVHTLVDAMRHVVEVLVAVKPVTIWSHIARFFETATPIERGRLKQMIGPDRDRFDRTRHTGPGPLFGVPQDPILKWADEAADRPPLLIDFFPILSDSDDGVREWHPALEAIATRYGTQEAFLKALSGRMRPSSWSGSIVPLLEVYLAPLENWYKHPVRELAKWAKSMHQSLEVQIEREQQYDDS